MAEPEADDPFAHTRMTLGEHLAELRKRLIRGGLTLVVAFVVALYFRVPITQIIGEPYRQVVVRLNEHYREQAEERVTKHPEERDRYFEPDGTFRRQIDERLEVLSPTEGMWFTLKVCGYFALVVASPVLLWQLWQFVAAGLYEREKRWARRLFAPAVLLFALGVLFSYFLLVPYGLFYLLKGLPIDLVKPSIRLEFYFSFLTTLTLSMGLVFQLPMLMTMLAAVGIVEPGSFGRLRGHFAIGAFVLAAILTPGPDVFSQVAMALPMLLLYEIGILGARLGARRRAAATQSARA